MKKSFKIIALVLCLATLCVTLCSCQALDERRENQAVMIDDTSFSFHDHTYKKMPISSKLQFIMNDPIGFQSFLTDKDVPVLLSAMYGYSMTYEYSEKDDPIVVSIYKKYQGLEFPSLGPRVSAVLSDNLDEYEEYQWGETVVEYYVREDQYDSVKRSIDNVELDHFYIRVYEPDNEFEPWDGGKYSNVLLDDAAAEAVRRTLKDGEKVDVRSLKDEGNWVDIYINTCDKDIVVTDNLGPIHFITDTFDQYLCYDNDITTLYKVKDEDFEYFRKLYSLSKDDLDYIDLYYFRGNYYDPEYDVYVER